MTHTSGYASRDHQVSIATGPYPVNIAVSETLLHRNRLTCAFRGILAIPHLLLVGGPAVFVLGFPLYEPGQPGLSWSAGGVLRGVAIVAALIAWFAIVFTGRSPAGLWKLGAFYLRWRVRASAYVMLLTDEYPPFGDGVYPAALGLPEPVAPRNRMTVAFRPILAIPHILIVWGLSMAWIVTTFLAWVHILFTGRYPSGLYHFGVSVMRWGTRLDAYLLLLRDEYPPFAFE